MTMTILAVLVLIALFSIAAFVMSADEPREYSDPRDNPLLWFEVGRH
jgi:hypothetical protein